MKKYLQRFTLTCVLLMSTSLLAQQLSDYSVLPQTATITPDQTPNVIFIIDSSGSMRMNGRGTHVGGHRSDSRSYSVRSVLRGLLNDNIGKMNVSIMSFGGVSREATRRNFSVYNCGGFNPNSCSGNRVSLWGKTLTGKGALLSNMAPLNNQSKDSINRILATEPQLPPLTGRDYWASFYGFYSRTNTMYEQGILLSQGGTPLRGSLETAYRYLINRSLPSNEVSLAFENRITYPASVPSSSECSAKTYVFLVTDGDPTIDPNGRVANTAQEVPRVAQAAATLRNQGVPVFVFGFQITGSSQQNMHTISQAGSGQNAFISNNAASLKEQIQSALVSILPPGGSGSGVSIVENSTQVAGALTQALYQPSIAGQENGVEKEVHWVSNLNAYFIDRYGYIREDAGTKGKLDDYNTDKAIKIQLATNSQGEQELVATRLNVSNIGTPDFREVVAQNNVPIDKLNTIWSADKILTQPYLNATGNRRVQIAQKYGNLNRAYNSVASDANGYRKIYSWIQNNPNSSASIDQGKQIEFIYDRNNANTINARNFTLLGTNNSNHAANIIRFIRGQEDITNFRSRSINDTAYLLGDIINSSATQIDSPEITSFTKYKDSSYDDFIEKYQNRRRVVYVGANDGLLHAFNAGFWDGENTQFTLTGKNDNTRHKLGAEIWAYAPMNLLPHLQWLTRKDYDSSAHVAYMDGAVQAFDVQAFETDDTHPNGWGTILVAGMRLGGGDYPNVDSDANPNTNNNFTARSAYIIIDVTDPSQEPKVIGEISLEGLNFTTSKPTIMKDNEDWYLVFGSGPNDAQTVTNNTEKPKLYRYRLNQNNRGLTNEGLTLNSSPAGFIGNPVSVDWNNDNTDDAVYFGTVTGTEATPAGALYRYHNQGAQKGSTEMVLNTNQPVFDAPLLVNYLGKRWAFFGTGRYLSRSDEDNATQNTFYGLKVSNNTIRKNALIDVTGVDVIQRVRQGSSRQRSGELSPKIRNYTTFSELRKAMLSDDNIQGWRNDYFVSNPSVKNASSALSYDSYLLYTYYQPTTKNNNSCEARNAGASYLDVVDLATGTAPYFTSRGFLTPLGIENSGKVTKSTKLGTGYAYQSYLQIAADRKNKNAKKAILSTPLGTGEIKQTPLNLINSGTSRQGRTSWREITQ